MNTTMPLKEAVSPYIQKDQVAGKMFDGESQALLMTPTVCVHLTLGGKLKTSLTKVSDFEAILAGTFVYTDLNETVTTSSGSINEDKTYVDVKYLEGEQTAVDPTKVPAGMVAIPVIFVGAFMAVKIKYETIQTSTIRKYLLEV